MEYAGLTKMQAMSILSAVATKDLLRGWGNLPAYLTSWHCPNCQPKKAEHKIEDWAIVQVQLGANSCEGRKCPECEWVASQVGDSEQMIPQEVQEKIKKRVEEEEISRGHRPAKV